MTAPAMARRHGVGVLALVFAVATPARCAAAAARPAPPASEPAAVAALTAAAEAEARVHSGRIEYVKTHHRIRLTDQQVRRLSWRLAPDRLAVQLQINAQQREWVRETGTLTFDHREPMDRIVVWGEEDNTRGRFRMVWGNDGWWNYEERFDPAGMGQQLLVAPPRLIYSPYDLLAAARFGIWLGAVEARKARVKVVHADPAHGLIVLLYTRNDDPELGVKVWLNTREGYVSTAQDTVGLKSGRVRWRSRIAYARYGANTYPRLVETTQYAYDQQGTPIAVLGISTNVRAAELNTALERSELAFGRAPGNTIVTDKRFDPPLIYRQTDHDYTDEELFEMHRQQNSRPRPR